MPYLTTAALFYFALASLASAQAARSEGPLSLPAPPPLPAEMRNRAPLQPPADLPDPAELMDQLRQLQELIAMSPEKLAKLRQSIEFIERMSPAEREAMRIRLAQVTQLNKELQMEVDELHAIAPEIRKSNIAQFWIASSEDDRETTRRELSLTESTSEKARLLSRKVDVFVRKREATLDKMRARSPANKPSSVPRD